MNSNENGAPLGPVSLSRIEVGQIGAFCCATMQ